MEAHCVLCDLQAGSIMQNKFSFQIVQQDSVLCAVLKSPQV
jgi:hypothetical protein